MLKIALTLSVLLASGARAETRAADMVQPVPAATISRTSSQQTTRTIHKNGEPIAVIEHVATPETTIHAATDDGLPAPHLIDDLDLEATMKKIGDNFKLLREAKTAAEMAVPAQQMAAYAGQAQRIGLIGASNTLQQAYVDEMQTLREAIATLEQLIAADDFKAAKAQIKTLNQMRRDGHRAFKDY